MNRCYEYRFFLIFLVFWGSEAAFSRTCNTSVTITLPEGGPNGATTSLGPVPIPGPRSDTRPDFDIYNEADSELSARSDTYIPKTVEVGQRIRLQLETQVGNADVKDSLRDSDSRSIEGPVWWRIETNAGTVERGWSLYVSEEFDVDDLDKGDSPDEEEWFTVPNYPGKTITFAACTDGDDEVLEEDENTTRRKATSPSSCGTNNRSRDEKLRISHIKPWVSTWGASDITNSSAKLRGRIDPQSAPTYGYFDYGTSLNFGSTIYLGNIGSGNDPILKESSIGGLSCGVEYFYRIRATNQGGTTNGNVESFRTPKCLGVTDDIVPVFGLWSSAVSGHHMTISASGRDNLINHETWDWVYEGVYHYALKQKINNAVPVYRFWLSGEKSHHMYTTSESERAALIAGGEWEYEGVSFHVYANQRIGSIPIYRYYNRHSTDHFFPKSAPSHFNSECNWTGKSLNGKNSLSSTNYNHCYEGVAWYGYSNIPTKPSVITGAATSVSTDSATLNANINPYATSTSAVFEYGESTSYGKSVSAGDVGSDLSNISITKDIDGLRCGTTYHFRATASNDGGFTNGADNTFVTGACAAPDLIVGESATIKEIVEVDEYFRASATVKNQGAGPSSATTLEFYLSTDAEISTDDLLMGAESINALAVNQIVAGYANIEAPSQVGGYWVGACVLSSNNEVVTSNNCSAATEITVQDTLLPDLSVSDVSWTGKTFQNKQIMLSVTVRNLGDADALATSGIIYLLTNGEYVEANTFDVAELDIGSLEQVSVPIVAPNEIGQLGLYVCVNSGNNHDPYVDNDCYLGSINVEEGVDVYVEIQGQGSVTSNPSRLACSNGTCRGTFNAGSTVTLIPHFQNGWKFVRWDPDACHQNESVCELTVSTTQAVKAIFEQNGETRVINITPIIQLLLLDD